MARIAASAGAGGVGSLWSPRWRTTSVSLLLSIGVVAFDELGVTTALPRVAVELDGLATYGAAVSSTVLATLVGSAVSGHLADRRDSAAPSAVGYVVFAVGLVVSGNAADWSTFLIGRVIQGLGAGAVVAMVYVVLMRRLPPELRSPALALVSSAWMVPSLAGPSVSGLLTETLGWRSVFAVLLALAVTAGGVSMLVNRHTRTIEAPTETGRTRRAPARRWRPLRGRPFSRWRWRACSRGSPGSPGPTAGCCSSTWRWSPPAPWPLWPRCVG